jgi:hypothetical protein
VAWLPLLRRLLPYLGAVLIVLGALWAAYRHGVRVTEQRWALRLATDLNNALELVRAAEAEASERVAALDRKHTQELKDVRTEADRTVVALRRAELRLRDRFTCPSVPSPSGSPGVGDGAAPGGLRSEDAELLIREAERADSVAVQLAACQALLSEWK